MRESNNISDLPELLEDINNKQDLDIIFSGVPPLHNQYSIIVINPEKHSHVKFELADHFSKWITSKEGQNNISKYQIMGEQLFFPNSLERLSPLSPDRADAKGS